ncbi:hypothetical protein C2W62_54195, partial [Candidatus Entotheonella serta]
QSLPERFQDVEGASGPGIDQAPVGRVLHDLFGITFFQDALGKSLLGFLSHQVPRLRGIWADGAYTGPLVDWGWRLRRYRKIR